MGYCYSYDGKLSCDVCGATNGQTRKIRCRFGYCPSPALCPACKKGDTYAQWRANCRKRCKAASTRLRERERLRNYLMDSGQLVRISAISAPDGAVDVTFAGRQEVAIYRMSVDTYHAIDSGEVARPKDFAAHGAIARVTTGRQADSEGP